MSIGQKKFRWLTLAALGAPVFSPSDISGLQLWYDASDAANYTLVSGEYSVLNDKSVNGYDVTANAGERPQQGTMNGLNCLAPDGSEWLQRGDLGGHAGLDNIGFCTWVCVFETPGTLGNHRFFSIGNQEGGTWSDGPDAYIDTTGPRWLYAINHKFAQPAATPSTSTRYVIMVTWDNTEDTTVRWYINSTTAEVDATSGSPGDSNNDTHGDEQTTHIGICADFTGGGKFTGKVGECLVYNKVLDSSERSDLINHLGDKWGVTIS